jgi:hypothetical protein
VVKYNRNLHGCNASSKDESPMIVHGAAREADLFAMSSPPLTSQLPAVWKVMPGGPAASSSAVGSSSVASSSGGTSTELRPQADERKDRRAIPQRLAPCISLLLQAHEYAETTGRDLMDFAVEVVDLRQLGMTNTDCRWFVCEGWAQLAREVKPAPGESRRFQHNVGLTIHRRACLVLTPAGERVARRMAMRASGRPRSDQRKIVRAETIGRTIPHWDRDRRELRLGSRLIKQFKLPSPNQEMILTVFDEENWPARIDDPLSPSTTVNTKQRLHDTIKNLNRNQKQRLIRFLGDGTGQGVRWELIADDSKTATPQS